MLHEVTRSTASPRFRRIPLLDSPPVLSAPLPYSSTQLGTAERSKLQKCRTRALFQMDRLHHVVLKALVVCVLVLSGMQEADAAPIGMCADTAQSIEAPPPMFPADNAELSPTDASTPFGCQSSRDERFLMQEPGAPSDRVAPSAETPDEKVVLGDLVPVLRAPSVPFSLLRGDFSLPEEHRWRGLRPPRC